MNTAIIISFDQLSAHFLGPYGNTLVQTPQFNRLAARSLLFDFAFTDDLNLSRWFDQIWSVDIEHPPDPTISQKSTNSMNSLEPMALADWASQFGYESTLITDDPKVASHRLAKFDRVILIDQPEVLIAAEDLSETQLANFFAQAIGWLEREFSAGQLCWIHSRGLAGAWDAPQAWRQYFAAQDDPDPPRFVEPPEGQWTEGEIDLDQILGWQQAAAAQVQVLDQCLGILLDQLQETSNRWATGGLLFGVIGCRGFALGEHQCLGGDQRFYNENVHVPLMFSILTDESLDSTLDSTLDSVVFGTSRRLADCDIFPGRSMAMVKTSLSTAVLQTWLASDFHSFENAESKNQSNTDFWLALDCPTPDYQHDYVYLADATGDVEMLQTHAWKIILGSHGHVELYAKPEDRWEINEVSDRCPEIVDKLKTLIQQLLPQVQENGIPNLQAGATQTDKRLKLPLVVSQRFD